MWKGLENQGKVREFKNYLLEQYSENIRTLLKVKGYTFRKDNPCIEVFIYPPLEAITSGGANFLQDKLPLAMLIKDYDQLL